MRSSTAGSYGAERRWAEREALDEIAGHIERGDIYEAFRIARAAERYRPDDPELERVLDRITIPVAVNTDPPGAEVRVKGYATPAATWELMGVTPFTIRFPYAMMRWRITLDGYEPFEGAPLSGLTIAELVRGIRLDPIGSVPARTVRIPGGPTAAPGNLQPRGGPLPPLGSYFLERYEVTNREYEEFVQAGGYARPEWWPAMMTRDGRVVVWEDAMAAFRDRTGRPGPSTWESGRYSAGEDDYPVGGISWFEAAAYCAFAGRHLPSLHHWFRAIGQEQLSDILLFSNLAGTAKAPVGRFQGISAYGNYDMAGNVKEWVWNATEDGQRYILGAAWNEPAYLFRHGIAQDPWDRGAGNGVRCAVYPEPPPEPLLAPITPALAYEMPPPAPTTCSSSCAACTCTIGRRWRRPSSASMTAGACTGARPFRSGRPTARSAWRCTGFVPAPFRPEVHPAVFAPRVRLPTLMINGEDDFLMPYELAQVPFFELLGAPAEHKRLARLAGGHIPTRRQDVVREVLDWLDRYLGPVGSPATVGINAGAR